MHTLAAAMPGGHLLSPATIAGSSPFLAPPAAPPSSITGVAVPRRVTAKQLAAERRRLKEEKKRAETST